MTRFAFGALFVLLALSASAREPVSLRLMTYNIRLDIASDGPNAWPHRRDWVVAQVEWLHPDLFGMREVLPNQKADLAARPPRRSVRPRRSTDSRIRPRALRRSITCWLAKASTSSASWSSRRSSTGAGLRITFR